ncbi:M61 family metallopeptidase [Pseudohongiella sp.]|uniref:PDZ domain-containing protein n=1 Tax=marine sediment metagenome TaxID=412755 RepID=A0A0F9YFF6_9ZZZZ|nr:PDZ domain-containing protein [Pseudohongiella sp.]HDZ08288.1 M61 family peptidase [Pseudohongiella sp.]HEA62564.1 M61 family peptidase [Pseudohongiella sp.]
MRVKQAHVGPGRHTLTAALLSAVLICLSWAANAAETSYRVDLSERAMQQVTIEARFSDATGDTLDFHLPVWRSGLYLVLDFVGTVSGMEVSDENGEALAFEQTAKSSWRVTRPDSGAGDVVVRYRVYANSLTDRTRHVDADHAFLNPAAVFVYADEFRGQPIEVSIALPADWQAASGMEQPDPGRFVAPHYDRLVDSPIEAGTFDLVTFEAAGMTVDFLIHGIWDGDEERLANDMSALVTATAEVFAASNTGLPTDYYLFMLHSGDGLGGGTEYYNSTLVHTDPRAFWDDERWQSFLGLMAHEFFHTWNVKRFRPAAIDRYDYQNINYTELLWVAEGLTSYYDQLLPVRAGLVPVDDYRDQLADAISSVVDAPGYNQDTLARASLEAWTKGFHRGADRAPDKPNRTVSFYSQGGLLGLVLDLEIRRTSDGDRSLDTVMTSLYDDFPLGGGGFTYADFRERLAAAGGDALAEQLDGWVYDTQPLPLTEALQSIGWRLDREDTSEDPVQVSLDVSLRGNPPVVFSPRLNGAAWRAGINAGDELMALDGARIGSNLNALLRRYSPGDEVEFSLFRDGLLKTVPVTLNPVRGDHEIEVDDDVSEQVRGMRVDWLGVAEEQGEE